LRQDDRARGMGLLHKPLLDDHPTDRMSDQDRTCGFQILEELPQRSSQFTDAYLHERFRSTIARHIPRNRAELASELAELTPPSTRRAPDTVEKHQRNRLIVARRFISEPSGLRYA
jgi:hypothetical protein